MCVFHKKKNHINISVNIIWSHFNKAYFLVRNIATACILKLFFSYLCYVPKAHPRKSEVPRCSARLVCAGGAVIAVVCVIGGFVGGGVEVVGVVDDRHLVELVERHYTTGESSFVSNGRVVTVDFKLKLEVISLGFGARIYRRTSVIWLTFDISPTFFILRKI